MKIKQFHIYLADLGVSFGAEPGKIRPVIVVQTNNINDTHPSTMVCPITSQLIEAAYPLRIRLESNEFGLKFDSDILVDQLRAIDNQRFKKYLGHLPVYQQKQLMNSLYTLLFE